MTSSHGGRKKIMYVRTQLAAAHLAAQPAAADAYALTPGRLVGSVAALVALAGVIVGVLALARRAGNGGRRAAGAALVSGLIGIAAGAIVVAAAQGGPGTGYGIVGGYVAMVIGLIATGLGGLAMTRTRRA
jgi:hypothetical protein